MSVSPESASHRHGETPPHSGAVQSPPVDGLAIRLIAGDEAVLGELWESQARAAECWLATHYTALRPFEREDVVQDAMVRLWNARFSVDPERNLVAYFHTIVRSTAIDRLKSAWHRQRRRESCLAPDALAAVAIANDADGAGPASHRGSQASLPRGVRDSLERLSEIQRTILWADARAPEDVASSRELAQELGIAPSRIPAERHRAIRKLRLELPPTRGGGAAPPEHVEHES